MRMLVSAFADPTYHIVGHLMLPLICSNCEHPDEMMHNYAAFPHIGDALFAKTKSIFREIDTIFLIFITCDPSICAMDHPHINV